MPHDPTTSLSLLEQARAGQNSAWQRIVEIYGPVIFGQCRRKGFGHADAQEIAQEIFTTIASKLNSFRRDRPGDSFLRWIRTITTRKMIDHIRQVSKKPIASGGTSAQMRMSQLPEPVELEDWSPDELRKQAFSQALHIMKSNFEERTWKAFWLTVVDGRTTKEVCEQLDMKSGAVRNARYKVHNRLMDELGDLLD